MIFTFDPPETGWTLSGGASISADAGAVSPPNVLRLFSSRGLPSNVVSSAGRTVALTLGSSYPVRVWTNGDGAGTVPLRIVLNDGVSPVIWDLAAPLGAGLQLWEPGIFVPASASVDVVVASLLPPSGAGTWLLDDFEIDEGASVGLLGKHEAITAAIGVLKGINGTPYKTNVGGRVFTRLFTPTERPSQEKPYICLPLDGENEDISYEGFLFTSDWALVGHAFFDDDPEASIDDAAGAELAAKFRDDVVRAFMLNDRLGGQTLEAMVSNVTTSSGIVLDGYAEVIFTIRFRQMGGAADLES